MREGHASDVGSVREWNEDSFAACAAIGLWAIADGMGGHQSGEVASAIAVTELARQIADGAPLVQAIEAAHREIQRAAADGLGAAGMGTTIVALKLDGPSYQIAWVGDSRAYLWNGALKLLTKDHSIVQMLIDAGAIDEDEAAAHPYRNVIAQALGTGGADPERITVAMTAGILAQGDCLLLCSDGLTGELSSRAISEILAASDDNQERVDRLIDAAKRCGGRDNITVIAVSP